MNTTTVPHRWAPGTGRACLRAILMATLALSTSRTASGANSSWSGVPVVEPIMPSDVRVPVSQFNFNNLAWQQFITLNWAADPNNPGQPDPSVSGSSFGTPGDTTPVVWESYKEASEVFRPNAEPPMPWGAQRSLPAAFAQIPGPKALKATSRFGVKGLFASSKFTDGPNLDLSEFTEAFTGGAWLTAQPKMNNYLTLFEKRLNQDEFNYINQNQLYDASNQAQFAITQGINLPDGSSAFVSSGTTGAIEVKAAWIELDDSSLWPLFKISQAYVSYPSSTGPTPPKLVTVGLVGLHIIRKTPNAQQFMWSTFEHVNNAPSTTDIQKQTLKAWYTYYNPTCNSGTDHYQCKANAQPVPGKDPYNAPIQVVRTTPLSNTTVNGIVQLNQNVWATIQTANPNSVFLNYQLVNVLWPNANSTINPGATIPLTNGNAQPPEAQQPVANTTLETYHQDITCLTCHVSAPVASTSASSKKLKLRIHPAAVAEKAAKAAASGTNGTLASDYSFLFQEAQTKPTPTPTPSAQAKGAKQ